MGFGASKIGQLVRWGAKKSPTFVQSISVDLSRETQDRIGQVFGILSADADQRAGDALIATIEDALVRGINEGLLRKDAAPDKIFEGAVARVNAALTRLVEERRLPIEPTGARSVLVLQKGGDVVIATWGAPHVLLFHVSDRRPGGRIYDLLATEQGVPTVGASRGYANIISGKIGERDRLLLATHDLCEWLPKDELLRIVLNGAPDAASVELQETLMRAAPKLAVALLLVDAERADAAPASGPYAYPSAPQHSMDTHAGATDRTDRNLLHRLSKSAADGLRQAKEALLKDEGVDEVVEDEVVITETHTATSSTEHFSILEDLRVAPPSADAPANAPADTRAADAPTVRHGGSTPPPPVSPFVAPSSSVPRDDGRSFARYRQKLVTTLRRFADNTIMDVIHNFNGLGKRRRLLLLSSLALILLLNHSVALADWGRHGAVSAAAQGKLVASIEQKIDSAESSIIYRDEQRARALLDEASALVAALPDRSGAEKADKARLEELIEGKFDALRHAIALPAPEILASVSTAKGPSDLRRMVVRQPALWAVGADGIVFKVDAKDGAVKEAGGSTANPTIFALASNGLLSGTKNGLTRFNYASDGSTAVALDLGSEEVDVTDADTFGTRLYILDAMRNRIVRFDAGTNGYGKPGFYMKDGTDLSKAVSMAIDGSVYVAMQDGTVTRFLSGVREDFAVQKTDPAVVQPIKIRTSDKTDKLYLLDRSSPARIISFSKKTGMLVAQYVSAELDDVTDFSVDEAAKTITATRGNSILKFAIPEAQ